MHPGKFAKWAFGLLFCLVSLCVAASPEEWAKGNITIGDRSVTMQHAYVRETFPGELQIILSDAPLTSNLMVHTNELLEQAQAKKLTAIVILVTANAQDRLSASIYDSELENGIAGGPNFGKLTASTLTATLAEGDFTIPERRVPHKILIQGSIQFHAIAGAGGMHSMDDFLDTHPGTRRFLNRVTETFGAWGGWIVWIPFGALILAALLWALVIAPRKAERLLKQIQKLGYQQADPNKPDLEKAIEKLAPYCMQGPASPENREYNKRVLNALEMPGFSPKYIANIAQTYDTSTYRKSIYTLWFTIALELRGLPIQEEFFIHPRGADGKHTEDRSARFGLRECKEVATDPEFAGLFSVWTKDGGPVDVPQPIQQAFLSTSNIFVPQDKSFRSSLRRDLLWEANTKFTPEGWGLCASNVWLDKIKLACFVKAFHEISAVLDRMRA